MSQQSGKTPVKLIIFVLALGVLLIILFSNLVGSNYKLKSSDYGHTSSTSSLSISSVGFAGLYELLQESGPGIQRIGQGDLSSGPSGLYLKSYEGSSSLMLHVYTQKDPKKPTVKKAFLIFLPKWSYGKHPDNKSWVADQDLYPENLVEFFIDFFFGSEGEMGVTRLPWPGGQDFKTAFSTPSPAGKWELQVLTDYDESKFEPIVSTPKGLMVTRFIEDNSYPIYLVSDPDVANNMGLGVGENTVFTMRLIQYIMKRENLPDTLAFFEPSSSGPDIGKSDGDFLGPMTTFPMFIILILTFISALCFLAALGWRFGGLVSNQLQEIRFGKAKLIDNSAKLMARPNLLPSTLDVYWRMTIQWAGKALHAPNLDEWGLVSWLDRVAMAKGVRPSLQTILTRIRTAKQGGPEEEMLRCALALYKFRKELESGPSHTGRSGQ